ncbi:MAG: thioredoxin domain-containing protein [Myxococcota bacterium]
MKRCALLALWFASCTCGPSAPTQTPESEGEAVTIQNPSLPGVEGDAALDQRLAEALAAKGPDYVPRTRHMNGDAPMYTNRLIEETSPYLLQHAHNPVNWSPWGDEAFARARAEGKAVLLSVGYSTCHWCHVMEHESFEDEAIAEYINAHFVPIKVDREERPDIDAIYMSAVHAMTGRGGWPMTVVMTPDGDPFFAGTYFPPRSGVRGARRGFDGILRELAERYASAPSEVLAEAQNLSQRLMAQAAPQPPSGVPSASIIPQFARRIADGFDPVRGGFSRPPKFPQPARLGLLLRAARRQGDDALAEKVFFTLRKMAGGGMYDHAAGGFHRYSTDSEWLVPHFEKMLYDNAQLAVAYLEGYQASGDTDFVRVTREILDYVDREMRSPDGLFYSATDADSLAPGTDLNANGNANADGATHMEEGYHFTWTAAELEEAVRTGWSSERSTGPSERPGVDFALQALRSYHPMQPNFEGRIILHAPRTIGEVAASLSVERNVLQDTLRRIHAILREAREVRPAPLRDDKVLTAWNGLMVSAYAKAALAFADERYLEIATRAAEQLLGLVDDEGRLMRSRREGRVRHRAYLEDYAFLIAGLLDVHEASGDTRWGEAALTLQRELDAHFADRASDPEGGAYFVTADDAPALLTREKPFQDGAIPSGNSVQLDNLLRLEQLTGEERYRSQAESLLSAFGSALRRYGHAAPRMLMGLDRYTDTAREVVIASESAPYAQPSALMRSLGATFLPNRVATLVQGSTPSESALPFLRGKGPIDGEPTAYVCERGRCEQPAQDASTFERQLAPVLPYPTEETP